MHTKRPCGFYRRAVDLFDGVAISSKYGIKKQNVEFYKKAVNEFNISDYNIIVVGNDYDEDIAPSKELGYKTVFIETNLTPITSNKKNVYGFDKEYIYSAIDKLKQ